MEKFNFEKLNLDRNPPYTFVDIKEEIDMLDVNFHYLENSFRKMKDRIQNETSGKNKLQVDTLSKIRLLFKDFENLTRSMDDIITSLVLKNKWSLTEEDIERINNERESDELFKTFLPLMLSYKINKDIEKNT